MATVSGGDKLMAYLKTIDANLMSAGTSPEVRVGFLEGATYPDGKSVPMIAALQEFGGTIHHDPGTVTVYRKVSASGTHFLRQGRFVKRREANFSSSHAHGAYSVTIPPRPFFRNMIAKYGPQWGKNIAVILKSEQFYVPTTLRNMGELISGQLRQSIHDTNDPPLAASTIARKGFSKPLIDTGHMLNSIDYEISGRSRAPGSFGGLAVKFG